MNRIAVLGPSGSGKSTLARRLASRFKLPWLELDSVFHQPGWTTPPPAQFRDRVAEFVAKDSWVVDGNYARSRDLVLGRADTVVCASTAAGNRHEAGAEAHVCPSPAAT